MKAVCREMVEILALKINTTLKSTLHLSLLLAFALFCNEVLVEARSPRAFTSNTALPHFHDMCLEYL
jgi:hypothetical protein